MTGALDESETDPTTLQGRTVRRLVVILVSAAVTIAAATLLEPVVQPRFKRPPGPGTGRFPNVLLRTHQNKSVRFYDDLVKGRIVVINFMYTVCQGGCIGTTENLVKVQSLLGDRVGRDIFLISITLDPEHDTPEALDEYARLYGVKPGWQFLTGRKQDIELLRRRLGFVDLDPAVDAKRVEHAGVIVFGNETLDRWAACPALTKPSQIVQTILWLDASSSAPPETAARSDEMFRDHANILPTTSPPTSVSRKSLP
jgi:protein SCO1/2